MSDRYFGKIVHVRDKYTVVLNAGSDHGVTIGKRFLIIGLGETITDPDTNEELERLEIVRGKAQVIHVQEKISTLRSVDFERRADVKEVTKVSSSRGFGLAGLAGPQDTVTEVIKPGEEHLKELKDVQVGDFAIAI